MSKSDAFELDILKHIFQNVDLAGIGDAGGLRGSAGAGSLYISLHSADPGEAGTQSTNEISYTGYQRVGVARGTGTWTCATSSGVSSAKNAAAITFGTCASLSATATYFGVGFAQTGGNVILYSGVLSTGSLPITTGITPFFPIGSLTVTED